MKSYIFISYSKSDKEYVQKLANQLRAEGFDIWLDDRNLRSSQVWWEAIVNAILNCAAFIVVMTPNSDQSRWVQREIAIADDLQKPMFPILAQGDMDSPNWLRFINIQYKDVRDFQLPSAQFFEDLSIEVNRKTEGKGKDVTSTKKINPVMKRNSTIQQHLADVPFDDTLLSDPLRSPRPIMFIALGLIPLVLGVILLSQTTESVPPTPTLEATTATASPPVDLNVPVSIEGINEWREQEGYSALQSNAVLNETADIHMRYLASMTIEELFSQNTALNAEGRDAQWMVEQAGYTGEVQMFVETSDTIEGTLGELLERLERQGGGRGVYERYNQIGFATYTNPVTRYHYIVVILGNTGEDL
jgi:hypothetical protein